MSHSFLTNLKRSQESNRSNALYAASSRSGSNYKHPTLRSTSNVVAVPTATPPPHPPLPPPPPQLSMLKMELESILIMYKPIIEDEIYIKIKSLIYSLILELSAI